MLRMKLPLPQTIQNQVIIQTPYREAPDPQDLTNQPILTTNRQATTRTHLELTSIVVLGDPNTFP